MAIPPLTLSVLQRVMGESCAQILAMRLQDDLEAHIGFQEHLLRLSSAGIACKRSSGVGATLCLAIANSYIYNILCICIEPISALLYQSSLLRAWSSLNYVESTFAQLSSSTPQSNLYRPRQIVPSDLRANIDYRTSYIGYRISSIEYRVLNIQY